ncbi:MAG: hypothetical protein EAZ37_07195 [Burkholderiales bacterium]|nr:MAG: hypothetical protein EAZ37_07195 [Burkholderiales bacterium]
MIRNTLISLTAALLCAGCVTLMPTIEKPYTLGAGLASVNAATISWRWQDARPKPAAENVSTRDGVLFGEAVLRPASFDFLQAEFARAVAAHEQSKEVQDKLRGKTIRLMVFESSAGLRVRLSESQQGKWDVMRAKIVIDLDGQRYESEDTHTFSNSDQPSPLSPAIRNAVEVLVNQIHLF